MPRGPFRVPLPSHLPPSGATEPLRSHSQSKVRTATHDGPGYCHGRSKIVWEMGSGFVSGCCDLIMNGVLAGESDEAPVGTGVLSQIPATGASSWVSHLCCRARTGR